MKLQIDSFFFVCVGMATNDKIIDRNKWTLLLCETVRQLKDVAHVLGGSRIKQIQITALTTTTRLSTL